METVSESLKVSSRNTKLFFLFRGTWTVLKGDKGEKVGKEL
jgi:hypothetical protein